MSKPDSTRSSVSPKPDHKIWVTSDTFEDDGEENQNVWGFKDTRYQLTADGQVEITGTRYSSSGQVLPHLIPWISGRLNVNLADAIAQGPRPLQYPPLVPAPVLNESFTKELEGFLSPDQISRDALQRLRHSHGHSQRDMYSVNYGTVERVVDLVLYPKNTEEVLSIMQAARRNGVHILPYGGGTNVSEALRCPNKPHDTIATVSMSRMNRVIWVDKVNGLARIQAGASGRHIDRALSKLDVTLGHEPDSFEFSTLGGWIATKASGMKKNKYGNIEDILIDAEIVTAAGILAPITDTPPPRVSVLNDVKSLIVGSEGSLGIVTSAIVKVFPLPTVQRYGSLLFRSFEDGFVFMRKLIESGQVPASVRLVDNTQFQFAQALKPASKGTIKAIKDFLLKIYLLKYLAYDPNMMSVCMLVFEGSDSQVKTQEAVVYSLGKSHGALDAGADAGKRGYEMTFAIAYIRDFAMTLNIMAESFETSCAWSQALDLCTRVKKRVWEEHHSRNLPGEPFITSRISQIYHSGVTVYFYLAVYCDGVDEPSDVFAELEEAARDEILLSGGSLSHHHGVGNLRKPFLGRVMSPAELKWRQSIQEGINAGMGRC
ncbi:oxidase, FAD binding protein [Xylariales sp. PMI_506]|nr:oxidase, FAD binding protein [Xylariales sp. PMI_506]